MTMTEVEWLKCEDPGQMLQPRSYRQRFHKAASQRKLRLLASGCCEKQWVLGWALYPKFLDVCEEYAEGTATFEELSAAVQPIYEGYGMPLGIYENYNPHGAVDDEQIAIIMALRTLDRPAVQQVISRLARSRKGRRIQCGIIRDIFGNPFRTTQSRRSWLSWNTGTIPKLAETIYADRAFDRLPILADALEEAGCTDADILQHCRAPGPHVRGCWVVDLILGKS